MNYYAVSFLLSPPPPPHTHYAVNPSLRGNMSVKENGVRTRCATIANHSARVNSLHILHLLRVVFWVRRGPLPKGPFRAKKDMALQTEVFYYCRSVLLYPYQFAAIFPRKQHLQTLHRSDCTMAEVTYYGRTDLLRVVFLVWRGFG